MQSGRSAILIRCTPEEAELIRRAAKHEHRTVSGFALNVMLKHIATRNDKEENDITERGRESA